LTIFSVGQLLSAEVVWWGLIACGDKDNFDWGFYEVFPQAIFTNAVFPPTSSQFPNSDFSQSRKAG